MMSERWQLHKAGIINFWYYDQQIFHFSQGRMLLRGSNGSGKSVTMQSFIPLLLDGNRSPERLDPFGSRARKLDNYMLEDNDTRQERIGYLYLEFKHPDSDVYQTIGMGIRARKDYPLDTWYFYLGQRLHMGENFSLYRNQNQTQVLTKGELTSAIGEKGQVFTTQREYMEAVNRYLFGFESIEEYRELINLLIQLRSPKLSKDFKPTVISEILTNSLQPLSDEDLRPLSESIENMDTIEANLAMMVQSLGAIKKLTQSFINYNSVVFYQRTQAFRSELQKLLQLQESIQVTQELVVQQQADLDKIRNTITQLQTESQVRSEQVARLQDHDILKLKEQETSAKNQLTETTVYKTQKVSQVEEKEAKLLKRHQQAKELKDNLELLKVSIQRQLNEMSIIANEISFEEHTLLQNEVTSHLGQVFSFGLTIQAIQSLKQAIRKAMESVRISLEQLASLERLYQEYDQSTTRMTDYEKQELEWDKLAESEKDQWYIQFKQWLDTNQVLVIQTGTEETIYQLVAHDRNGHFAELNRMIYQEQSLTERKINNELLQNQQMKQLIQLKLDELNEEFQAWVNRRDPEPPRAKAVELNRQALRDEGILHIPFYQLVDFKENLDAESVNHLEAILLDMGLLDALVVSKKDQARVLNSQQGRSERYLFVEEIKPLSDLNAVLEVVQQTADAQTDDIQEKITALHQIVSEMDTTASDVTDFKINPHAKQYQLGILHGMVDGNYEAKFIGQARRQAYRQRHLSQLETEIEQLQRELSETNTLISQLNAHKVQLGQEVNQLPDTSGITIAQQTRISFTQKFEDEQQKHSQLQKEVRASETAYKELKNQADQLCQQIKITPSMDKLNEALDASEDYQEQLNHLKEAYQNHLQTQQQFEQVEEAIAEDEWDLDNLRQELSRYENQEQKLSQDLAMIAQQLASAGFEDIARQLEEALARLAEIPSQVNEASRQQGSLDTEIVSNQQRTVQLKEDVQSVFERVTVFYQSYVDELSLAYVFEDKALALDRIEEAQNYFEQLKQNTFQSLLTKKWVGALQEGLKQLQSSAYYSPQTTSSRMDEAEQKLRDDYLIHKNQLADYMVNLERLFTYQAYSTQAGEWGLNLSRDNLKATSQGRQISIFELEQYVQEQVTVNEQLLQQKDRLLFEEVITNTIGRKIRSKIYLSETWVKEMNKLMSQAEEATSNGFTLALKWKHRGAQQEGELGSRELIDLLKMDAALMNEENSQKLTGHFRTKSKQARQQAEESGYSSTFHTMLKEVLDYRRWFEFQLSFKKAGEVMTELTNNKFDALSGGEKAMSMYIPLFSAVVAKYNGANRQAPRIISLDEAFAGIDDQNIRDMFRYMVQFDFNFIINSQILWGDYDTVPSMRIYQLLRPNNSKFVAVMSYLWDGVKRIAINDNEQNANLVGQADEK
ncbi:TIGR02680 family protein [Fundicoccus culcitae]|uniref:TIGR02680 family protein n=1 Tax=Fundicoccus culcitae TaxID=2969821 RepID=A0ABY5P400_9LACT|nr:TIGR02680 family protein [Fundicoccus culcitae]UUX33163.1 TIGR02680 family protein [Fundicoccus culcitae]